LVVVVLIEKRLDNSIVSVSDIFASAGHTAEGLWNENRRNVVEL